MYELIANTSGVLWLAAGGIVVGSYLIWDLIRGAFARDWDIVDFVEVDRGEIVEVDQ